MAETLAAAKAGPSPKVFGGRDRVLALVASAEERNHMVPSVVSIIRHYYAGSLSKYIGTLGKFWLIISK